MRLEDKKVTYEVFYRVGEFEDSIIIEGDSLEEVKEKTEKELEVRKAIFRYSNWLND